MLSAELSPLRPPTYNHAEHDARIWGFTEGRHSLDATIADLESEIDRLGTECDHERRAADRYYAELCRRRGVPFIDPSRPTFAELERRRGDPERAERIEARNDELLAIMFESIR